MLKFILLNWYKLHIKTCDFKQSMLLKQTGEDMIQLPDTAAFSDGKEWVNFSITVYLKPP